MVSMRNLLERFLKLCGYPYSRIEHELKEDRQSAIHLFNQDKDTLFLLLSIKELESDVHVSGADSLILYDYEWNPNLEAQVRY
jgi:helicase SWR1